MKLPFHIIQLLKRKSGNDLRLPSDCEFLSLDIESKTGILIGATTLKRLLGFTFVFRFRAFTMVRAFRFHHQNHHFWLGIMHYAGINKKTKFLVHNERRLLNISYLCNSRIKRRLWVQYLDARANIRLKYTPTKKKGCTFMSSMKVRKLSLVGTRSGTSKEYRYTRA